MKPKAKKDSTETMINNLKDFLAHLGADTPARAGRALYRATSCGPWTSFAVVEAPKDEDVKLEVAVSLRGGKPFASLKASKVGMKKTISDALLFLNFDAGGAYDGDDVKSLKEYRAMVETYLAENGESTAGYGGFKMVLHPGKNDVRITLEKHFPPEITQVYYEDEAARNADIPNCIGVKVGSIVEGSDASVSRETMFFPFSAESFDAMVQSVDEEADILWKRDNLDHYHLKYRGKDYYFDMEDGEAPKLPKSIASKVMEFLNSEAGALVSGSVNGPDEDGEMTKIPGTEATIEKHDGCDMDNDIGFPFLGLTRPPAGYKI